MQVACFPAVGESLVFKAHPVGMGIENNHAVGRFIILLPYY